MKSVSFDSLLDNVEPRGDVRRVSAEPIDGYVLDPWSGLYQETESTYRDRLRMAEALSA
jgi:DMSO/TMAO reductase YedYZ molybdopterin-dependent catalytic subunit